jgi:hypothetical protein
LISACRQVAAKAVEGLPPDACDDKRGAGREKADTVDDDDGRRRRVADGNRNFIIGVHEQKGGRPEAIERGSSGAINERAKEAQCRNAPFFA